jgi:hypothetical protein
VKSKYLQFFAVLLVGGCAVTGTRELALDSCFTQDTHVPGSQNLILFCISGNRPVQMLVFYSNIENSSPPTICRQSGILEGNIQKESRIKISGGTCENGRTTEAIEFNCVQREVNLLHCKDSLDNEVIFYREAHDKYVVK